MSDFWAPYPKFNKMPKIQKIQEKKNKKKFWFYPTDPIVHEYHPKVQIQSHFQNIQGNEEGPSEVPALSQRGLLKCLKF